MHPNIVERSLPYQSPYLDEIASCQFNLNEFNPGELEGDRGFYEAAIEIMAQVGTQVSDMLALGRKLDLEDESIYGYIAPSLVLRERHVEVLDLINKDQDLDKDEVLTNALGALPVLLFKNRDNENETNKLLAIAQQLFQPTSDAFKEGLTGRFYERMIATGKVE